MNKALFVIDVQKGMLSHIYNSVNFVENLLRLIEIARKRRMPIFFFKYIDTPKNVKRFNNDYWTKKGTKGAELISEIKVSKADYVFEKYQYNAFSVEELDEVLRKKKIKSLWLSGLVSQVCVQSTSDAAYERDYNVIVIKEAVGATNLKNLESGLLWMKKYSSEVISIKDLD